MSGNVKLGTDIDIGNPTFVYPTDDDDMAQGEVSIEYSNGGFHAGLDFGVYFGLYVEDNFAPPPDFLFYPYEKATISASAGYDGENFSVNAGMDILGFDSGSVFGVIFPTVTSLWGKWFLFEKQLEILLAYKGPETIYWQVSDMLSGNDWDNLDGEAGLQINWSPSFIEGLSLGFSFPVFGLRWVTDVTDQIVWDFFESTFSPFTAGVKFEQDAWSVGLMYTNNKGSDVGKAFVLMGSLDIAEGTHGIGAEVLLGNLQKGALAFLSIGACYDLSLDRFGAGLTVKLLELYLQGGSAGGELAIDAYGQYEIIEDTLLARLDIGLPIAFGGGVGLKFTPAVYYNPDASGISDDPDHALYLKAALGWDDLKGDFGATLTIGYRWAF